MIKCFTASLSWQQKTACEGRAGACALLKQRTLTLVASKPRAVELPIEHYKRRKTGIRTNAFLMFGYSPFHNLCPYGTSMSVGTQTPDHHLAEALKGFRPLPRWRRTTMTTTMATTTMTISTWPEKIQSQYMKGFFEFYWKIFWFLKNNILCHIDNCLMQLLLWNFLLNHISLSKYSLSQWHLQHSRTIVNQLKQKFTKLS